MSKFISIDNLSHYNDNIQDAISTKQDSLVSGTNIKTVNGESLLGPGNVVTGVKPLVSTTDVTIELLPNMYYRKTNTSSSLTITLAAETDSTILNEYLIEFKTALTGTTISLPSSIKWVNGEKPTFDADSTYQISIVNNLGVCIKFA